MKDYTVKEPEFHESIQIVETTDPVHADVANAAPKAIFENTLALKGITEAGGPEAFDNAKAYSLGDYCTHEGKIYKATEDIPEGDWDATKWKPTNVYNEIAGTQNGGGSTIRGTTTDESLFLRKAQAKKGDAVLAEITIGQDGKFVFSGIIETGEITITATDGKDVAETTVEITAYSLYEAELSFYTLYGFHVTDNESNPSDKITYIPGCDNEGFVPAKMDYSAGRFDYGSWTGKHQWFFPKPCMLKSDGTVAYYLNPDDYTQKEDGTPSDVSDANFDGNAMMEWGQNKKKIWIKVVPNPENVFEGDVYVCDKQLDEEFHAWSFYNNQDQLVDHFYTPIYNGAVISGKLRSMSGQTPLSGKTAQQEIDYAKANNPGSDVLWHTETYSERFMINVLLLLMAKTTDTQTAYGAGNIYYANNSGGSIMASGSMNDKGPFWGSDSTSAHIGVKVFGMEHWWGNIWRRIAGYINDRGTQKIKMTYGTADGSTADGYNTTGSGYVAIASSTPDGTSGGYISKIIFHPIFGMVPKTSSGSETTYYTDGNWFNNSQVDYAFVGGCCNDARQCGALCSSVNSAASYTAWNVGATVSCKPLAAQAQAGA